VCVCVYICIYSKCIFYNIYICYIYIYMFLYVCIYVCVYVYMCVYMYMYVCMCVCVCVFPAATQRPSKHDCITILKYMCVYYMSLGQHSSCTTSLELISRSHSPSGLIDQHQGTALLDTSVTVPRKANSFEHTGLGACTTVKTVGSSPTPAARTMAGNNFSKV